MKQTLLKTIHNFGGFAPFHWAARGKLLILMYHRFSREKNPYKISVREFEAHLEYLRRNCNILSLSEAVDRRQNEIALPPNSAVITIDDGYLDAYELAFPLLKKYELPATLYVVTDFIDEKCWIWTDLMRFVLLNTAKNTVEIEFADGDKINAGLLNEAQKIETASRINAQLKRLPNEQKDAKIKEIAQSLEVEIPLTPSADFAPVSWEMAREMDAGNLSIGSHTATHPILTNVNLSQLDFELCASKKRLEEILDRSVRHFCYPNGNYNETIQKAVKKAGYESATTTVYGFNQRSANPFTLNRIDAQPAIENFAQSASGFEALKQRIRN